MDQNVRHQNDKERIEAEAVEWVIRMGGPPLSPNEISDFERWRARSEFHAQAFEFSSQTWADLAELRHDPGTLAKDSVPVSRNQSSGRGILRKRNLGGAWVRAGILSICLLAAGSFFSYWYGNPIMIMAADYRTEPGEMRSVSLPDGTSVDLSSGSAIALQFSDKERRVELLTGAAYFTVVPKSSTETRPFVVQGGGGTATALGTQFLVSLVSGDVEVAVAEHDVRVALLGKEGHDESVVLSTGQAVRYSATNGLGHVQERNVELASSWRRGRLVFDQVPLAEVINELNHYRRGRIVIGSASLGNRKVSGAFQTEDLDDALHTIAREMGLKTASVPPLVTVLY
ncbi:FecR family protein [Brucella pseudogrignonensis]|uniref:FecR family protein n=1 Tax=Brucella pseudogrignonensis TaxID=419475 RepID=UPI001E45A3C8|nr:FecR family protein [Brucella pseudogrignonensis]MCD4514293.1 FecR family protein [Brucella pseudogrignonensis]